MSPTEKKLAAPRVSLRARTQLALIEKAIEHYERTGVAVFERDPVDVERNWRGADRLFEITPMRSTFRQMARELGRPFVHATTFTITQRWQEDMNDKWQCVAVPTIWHCALQFPRIKRLDVLAAPLLLLNCQPQRHIDAHWEYDPATKSRVKVRDGYNLDGYVDRYDFQMQGEEHRKVFEHFLHECEHNPTYRKALRLDR
jgi:hypothetical protein